MTHKIELSHQTKFKENNLTQFPSDASLNCLCLPAGRCPKLWGAILQWLQTPEELALCHLKLCPEERECSDLKLENHSGPETLVTPSPNTEYSGGSDGVLHQGSTRYWKILWLWRSGNLLLNSRSFTCGLMWSLDLSELIYCLD